MSGNNQQVSGSIVSNPQNIVILVGFSVLIGILIGILYYLDVSFYFRWILFPIVAYIMISTSHILQDVSSGVSINPGSTFTNGLISIPVILMTMLISTQFVIVRSPIVSLFMGSADHLDDIAMEETLHPYKKAIAISYYMFFGSLIGSIICRT